MAALREFVVRMHLHRQIVACVNYLYQQREAVAEATVDIFAHECGSVFVDKPGYRQSGVLAGVDHRLMPRHSGELPALANVVHIGVYRFKILYLFASPHYGL